MSIIGWMFLPTTAIVVYKFCHLKGQAWIRQLR